MDREPPDVVARLILDDVSLKLAMKGFLKRVRNFVTEKIPAHRTPAMPRVETCTIQVWNKESFLM